VSAAIEREEARVKLRGAPAFALIVVGYAAALAAGVVVARLLDAQPLWLRVAAADALATVVIFVFSLFTDCSSFYDPYWSVAPIPIVAWLATAPGAEAAPLARRVLVVALVTAWGLRLTWNWARGWTGFAAEDWRYVNLRKTTGGAYWLVSLLGLHLMPTVTVYLAMLPLFVALGHAAPFVDAGAPRPFGPIDVVAALVTAAAIVVEATADEQLRAFRRDNTTVGKICERGLWGRCRHPNYLGEVSLWWGLFGFGLAARPDGWWAYVVGAVWMTGLFTLISIPMIDKRSLARRPGYAEQMRRMPALLPLGPRAPARGGDRDRA
jgi:steroid 5-alpha reductase family enzyme